jgi:phosphate transport system substrate-binding protein
VVPAYHLAGLKEPLVFSGPVLAGIYLGKIKKWNDPALQALNSGVALPDQEINVIHRSDGSGTTYTWTEYLAKVSAEWKQVGTSITWPVGAGEPGNDAVTRRVKSTPWSIGYIPLPYALKEEVPFGLVQNAEGVPVKASVESVTAAAKAILPKIGEELAFSLANAPGKDSYPIGGATWAVVCAKQSGARGKALAEFFRWVIHEGQDKAEALHYSRLPSELVERVDRKLGAVAAP